MNLKDLTILYAEDEHNVQSAVCDVLEFYVDKIITASNGEEALELYKLYKPSILIFDICMPIKDGLEALKIIRETDLSTPAIIMTAHTENEYLMNAVELYITKYLVKPFNKKDLVNALNTCLELMNEKNIEELHLGNNIFYIQESQVIKKDNQLIPLSKKEKQLLNLLVSNANKVLPFEQIEYHIWDDIISRETLKSLIKDLRKKTFKELIQNMPGVGYKLVI